MSKNSSHTHTVMPKKLAEALMEAGVQHFDAGGQVPMDGGADPWAHAYGYFASGNAGRDGGNLVSGAGDTLKNAARSFTTLNDFQARAPNISTQNFNPQIGYLQAQQANAFNQQQTLAQQLLAQSQGRGPNPAQAALANSTGQNVAQQGALIASQRGANANPALMARLASNQGAQIQQNAAGQAAALQAQQQLAAQEGMRSLYGSMANQALQGESIQQGGQAAQNTAITTGQLGAQNINANISGANAAALNGTAGGITNALGAGLVNALYRGGEVKKMADGGIAEYSAPTAQPISMQEMKNPGLQINIQSSKKSKDKEGDEGSEEGGGFGKYLSQGKDWMGSLGFADGGEIDVPALDATPEGDENKATPLLGIQNFTQGLSGNGSAGAVPNQGVSAQAKGGGGGGGMLGGLMALLAQGGPAGVVPGKPEVNHNSEKNDVVPAMLSPGEVVLPLSVTQHEDAPSKAAEFMRHVLKKKSGYGSVIEARKMNCGGKVKR